jgi:hypothetical protein
VRPVKRGQINREDRNLGRWQKFAHDTKQEGFARRVRTVQLTAREEVLIGAGLLGHPERKTVKSLFRLKWGLARLPSWKRRGTYV